MKKVLLAWAAVLILILSAGTALADFDGWMLENGSYLVYYKNNAKVTGEQTIDGIAYNFTEDGYLKGNGKVQKAWDGLYYPGKDNVLQDGWQTVDGSKYYFYYHKAVIGFGWIGESVYYFDEDGKMRTGWVTDNDLKYYFGKDGKQLTGWQTIGKDKYYLKDAAYTGSRSVYDEKTQQYDFYYFDEDGKMQTGWVTFDGSRFYYGKDGKQLTGWQTIGNDKYYLNNYAYTGSVGIYNEETQQNDYYYFDEDGKMQTGWVTIEGYKYYYGKDGKQLIGWQTIGKDKYYLGKYAYTGSKSIYNEETEKYDNYYFDEDGKMQTGFVTVEEKIYYYDADGKRLDGWQKIGKDTYYLGYDGVYTGLKRVWHDYVTQESDLYYFGDDGKMQTGLISVGEDLYCFGEDGKAVSGWISPESGVYYYFSEYACTARKGLGYIDNKIYFFDDSGVMQTGWCYVGDYNTWKLFGADGTMVESFSEMASVEIPEKVDSLESNLFRGVDRSFVIYCKAGSYAEKYARLYGFQYDNGQKSVIGYQISDVGTKVKWIVENYTDASMSGIQKVRALHNWLIFNAHYDTTYSEYGANGVLIKGTGVCQSYALAYQMLLNEAGIENIYISGSADNGSGSGRVGHAWNMVKLGDNWYHVDTTWDDPTSTAYVSGWERYTYFLISDAEIGKNHFWSARVLASEGIEWTGEPGWLLTGTGWVYYDQRGNLVTQPAEVDGKFYGFGEDGRLLTLGWHQINGSYYYIYADGTVARNQWLSDGGYWYYCKDDGRMVTGWREIKGEYYYFEPGGQMATGWLNDNGTYYYLSAGGSMVTGWLGDGGEWYYLDSKTGAMRTGWIQVKGDWYLMDSSGAMLTGWQKSGGNWYFFRDSGKMVTGWYEEPANASHPDRSCWYWFDKDGRMGTGWQEIDGQWEMFDDSGVWLYTWDGN